MNESTPQQKIQYLVEKFHREEAAGAIAQYNESETKNGFIEPLLQSLGWNTQDRNEVGLEENVSGGRVDYSLRINGSPRIYIEAKPPRATETESIDFRGLNLICSKAGVDICRPCLISFNRIYSLKSD